ARGVEGCAEQLGRPGGTAGGEPLATLAGKPFESVEIQLSFLEVKRVARRLRREPLGGDRLAKLRDVDLERLRRRLGRVVAPERVDQLRDGNDAVPVQQQQGEQRARLAGGGRARTSA